ncbi:MAG: hypothetical protein WAV51_00210 [Microgenomates group bacterium]
MKNQWQVFKTFLYQERDYVKIRFRIICIVGAISFIYFFLLKMPRSPIISGLLLISLIVPLWGIAEGFFFYRKRARQREQFRETLKRDNPELFEKQ